MQHPVVVGAPSKGSDGVAAAGGRKGVYRLVGRWHDLILALHDRPAGEPVLLPGAIALVF
jgi:hypothetical protein